MDTDDKEHFESDQQVMEKTIETMESLQLCIDPVHKHSFAQGDMWKGKECPVNSALVPIDVKTEVTESIEDKVETAVMVPEQNGRVIPLDEQDESSILKESSSNGLGDSLVPVDEDTESSSEERQNELEQSLVHIDEQGGGSTLKESSSSGLGDSLVPVEEDTEGAFDERQNELEQSLVHIDERDGGSSLLKESSSNGLGDSLVPVEGISEGPSEERQNELEQSLVHIEEEDMGYLRQRRGSLDQSVVHVQEESDMLFPCSSTETVSESLDESFVDMHRQPLLDTEEDVASLESDIENGDYTEVEPSVILLDDDNERESGDCNGDENVKVEEPISFNKRDVLVAEAADSANRRDATHIPSPSSFQVVNSPTTSSSVNGSFRDGDDEVIMVWTPDGPPSHWACEKSLQGILSEADTAEADSDGDDTPLMEPLIHYESHPFANVSRVLQENVVAYFRKRDNSGAEAATNVPGIAKEQAVTESEEESKRADEDGVSESVILLDDKGDENDVSQEDVKALLTEIQPPSSQRENSVLQMASGTLEAVKTSARARKKLGFASVAGGIAGGAAGLFVAGPAGAVLGAKLGQTAGLLGVILEGSVSVGVFVAGVAAASYTAQQIQQNGEKRILAIGEGKKQKVLLVRPNVVVDPVWDELCANAIATAPAMKRSPFGILPNSEAKQAEMAKKERYQRDSDIVETDEYELPTEDKVLLLVSRSLNDKMSLPGHVYRCLIKNHRERTQEREKLAAEERASLKEMELQVVSGENGSPESHDGVPETSSRLRERRRDAHGVIKHVTATLLEVRPGFSSSPKITEMSATAVEGLVFGELYDDVFEEIVEETRETDQALLTKIKEFERTHMSENSGSVNQQVSAPALKALKMLPGAHSAVDKLRCCVDFLELISEQFSSQDKDREGNTNSSINADSLLKMVCQHIIVAKVPHINAEIAFLEEFARDEHLLKGREGYALVTLQASLHFLNASAEFEDDIF